LLVIHLYWLFILFCDAIWNLALVQSPVISVVFAFKKIELVGVLLYEILFWVIAICQLQERVIEGVFIFNCLNQSVKLHVVLSHQLAYWLILASLLCVYVLCVVLVIYFHPLSYCCIRLSMANLISADFLTSISLEILSNSSLCLSDSLTVILLSLFVLFLSILFSVLVLQR